MLFRSVIDALVLGPKVDSSQIDGRLIIQEPLEAGDIPYRHDRQLLRLALEHAVQAMV